MKKITVDNPFYAQGDWYIRRSRIISTRWYLYHRHYIDKKDNYLGGYSVENSICCRMCKRKVPSKILTFYNLLRKG